MDYIEKLKTMSPEAAERFIMTAIRFYAETLADGEPNTYFTKLTSVSYPGIEKEREADLDLAVNFLKWNDHQVSLNTTSLAGYQSEDEQTPDEVDAMAREGWKTEMKRIFGSDLYEDDQNGTRLTE
jgi:hypothetical protein